MILHISSFAPSVSEWIFAQSPAISGQGGHRRTFGVACGLARRGLDFSEALDWLRAYNQRCQPPWNERDLRHKLEDAYRKAHAAAPRETRAVPGKQRPDLHPGTERQLRNLATLRGLPLEAVHTARVMGVLRFGPWKGREAWFIRSLDGARVQARRMDGKPWEELHGAKAWTLPGSKGGLIGGEWIRPGGQARFLLVEGGPDYLAACDLWWRSELTGDGICIPLALLGASQSLPDSALAKLRGREVRIAAHGDEAGENAARRWAAQLDAAGARVSALFLRELQLARTDGRPVGDWNDLYQADAPARETVLRRLMGPIRPIGA